jgi:putative Holliday junction resolvase
MADSSKSVLALDVGGRRVGVALATLVARLPRPLTTLAWDEDFFKELEKIIIDKEVGTLVVGWPRGLQGQETAQTDIVRDFVQQLKEHFDLPIHQQDEAVTSRQAEAELEARGKNYEKSDIDALAATYILEDWLTENREVT